MKKLSDFSKGERVIAIIATVWLGIGFIFAVKAGENCYYHSGGLNSGGLRTACFDTADFMLVFFMFLLPVIIIIGVKWIRLAPKNSE